MKATAAFSYKGEVYAKGDSVNVTGDDADYLTKRKLVSGKAPAAPHEPAEVEQEPTPEKKTVTLSTEKKTIKKP